MSTTVDRLAASLLGQYVRQTGRASSILAGEHAFERDVHFGGRAMDVSVYREARVKAAERFSREQRLRRAALEAVEHQLKLETGYAPRRLVGVGFDGAVDSMVQLQVEGGPPRNGPMVVTFSLHENWLGRLGGLEPTNVAASSSVTAAEEETPFRVALRS